MSKFLKVFLAFVGTAFLATTIHAQATIEEVVVTAQRTEQSLQEVPIAVSAFSDEILAERQIEYASDLQLQVPGLTYSADGFNGGGFAIRGVANFAVSSSSDAGVMTHVNGLPLGSTATNELGFLDMQRIEVLRGPQGTLFGRNSTGGVINLITARPDLDEFYGNVKVQYGSDSLKNLDVMLNVPISDTLGMRIAFTNFEKDGVTKNLYSKATDNAFDDRDSYQWRATFQWNPTDDSSLTLMHNAYDEESNRIQINGVFCDTASSLVQGCVIGGNQVFDAIHPMSNGSTLPALLGQAISFYVPSNLTNGAAGGTKTYQPTGALQDTYTNRPTQFFETNDWKTPTHDVQESLTQLIYDHDFDQGSLSVAYSNKKRFFYRDAGSTSEEANGVRWLPTMAALPFYNEGFPMAFSNEIIKPNCTVKDFKNGSFCPNGEGIGNYSLNPQSGDASHAGSKQTTYEIKYVSDLDGPFNFLVGAIDISQSNNTMYDVYASGITGNGLLAPGSIAGNYRDAYNGLIFCSQAPAPVGPCTGPVIKQGKDLVAAAGLAKAQFVASGLPGADADLTNVAIAYDMTARIDGLYTENFHNVTERYGLDSAAIFTEFYFDVGDQHKLTLGLRYNEDTKSIVDNAYFYKVPLASNWNTAVLGTCGGFNKVGDAYIPKSISSISATTGAVTYNDSCVDGTAKTAGQAIGSTPNTGADNGSISLGPLPKDNANYVANNVDPIQDFSETTGRFVWDYQIDEDTLFYMSYSQGFKGGGFNPPFNAAKFPNTEFVYPSTEVKAVEFGVKATVPEAGLTANASFYYNDFKNYTISVIRNETGINEGLPLEQYGAELELYLAPPTVPGLTFNAMVNYQTSEIGTFSMINNHDIGLHYAGKTATSSKWHALKDSTANTFLVNKDGFGALYAKVNQLVLSQAGAAKAAVDALGAGATDEQKAAATKTANFNTVDALKGVNEIAYGIYCLDPNNDGDTADAECGGEGTPLDATDDKQSLVQGDLLRIFPFEMSSHATAYGERSDVCHILTALGGPNTCLTAALGGTATSTLVYAPDSVTVSGVEIAGPTGTLLPSIALRGTGTSTQTGGICKLFKAMTDHGSTVAGTANELTIAANEVCVETLTESGKWISTGFATDITGNEMPFPELSVGFGIAYTAQAGNVEVTPRLDYYYRSEYYNSVFNNDAYKIPAWDEWNFRLNIVPTNGDWNISIWGQNLTDDRNITGMSTTGSSTSHTTNVWVREPRSFGMSFGINF